MSDTTKEVLLSPEELEALAANCDGCTLRIEPMEADGDWMTYIRAHADGSTFTLHVRLDHGGEAHVEREDFEQTEPMSVEEARAVTRAPIEVGKQYAFYAEMQEDDKPQEERMRRFTEQTVTVVRPLRGLGEPDPESDWFEPTEDEQPEVSRGFIVRAADGTEFTALEEELNGWDRDLGSFFWPDGTHGWDHDTRYLVNEQRRVREQVPDTAGRTMTMRCADEPGWPERTFTAVEADGDDWCCDDCGWCQLDFPRGCRELVMSATWHGIDALIESLKVIQEAGLTLEGEITMRVDALALEAAANTPSSP